MSAARYNPWVHALSLDVQIQIAELPGDLRGCYSHSRQTIWLDPRLTLTQERVTLAHELIHHEREHSGRQSDGVEHDVDIEVARRCVDAELLQQMLDKGYCLDKRLHRAVLCDALGVDGVILDLAATGTDRSVRSQT